MKNLKLQELSKKELIEIDGGVKGPDGCIIPIIIIGVPPSPTFPEPNF